MTIEITNQRLALIQELTDDSILFPASRISDDEETLRSLDHQALLIMGAIRPDPAFKVLDEWLRFPRRQSVNLHNQMRADPHSYELAIQAAGRYAVGRMHDIISSPPRVANRFASTIDPNDHLYGSYMVYQQRRVELLTGASYARQRLQLARISVFGFLLFEKEHSSDSQRQ